jgi:hypothetical protein
MAGGEFDSADELVDLLALMYASAASSRRLRLICLGSGLDTIRFGIGTFTAKLQLSIQVNASDI